MLGGSRHFRWARTFQIQGRCLKWTVKSPPYGLLASFPLHSSCLTTRSTRDPREGSDVRSDPTGGRRVGDGDVRRRPNERSLQGRAVSQTVPNVSECAAPLKKPIGSNTGCSCMGQKKGLNRAKTWRRIWQHNIGVESSPTSEPGSHFRCSQPLHDCVCIARHGWGHLYLKNGTSNLHLLCRFSGHRVHNTIDPVDIALRLLVLVLAGCCYSKFQLWEIRPLSFWKDVVSCEKAEATSGGKMRPGQPSSNFV